MPARRRVAVDAVDVYARGAIDRIAHRIDVEFSGHAMFGAEYRHELDAGRFGENIDRPAALDIDSSVVGDNTDCAWGGWVGTSDLPETILFEDVNAVHHDSIVWGWSMRSNLWPAGTISGGCAVRYSGLRSCGHKQDSSEGHEKKDSGTHAESVVLIVPGGPANDSVAIHRPRYLVCAEQCTFFRFEHQRNEEASRRPFDSPVTALPQRQEYCSRDWKTNSRQLHGLKNTTSNRRPYDQHCVQLFHEPVFPVFTSGC